MPAHQYVALSQLAPQLTALGLGTFTASSTALTVQSPNVISLLAGRQGVGGSPTNINILANGTGLGVNCQG